MWVHPVIEPPLAPPRSCSRPRPRVRRHRPRPRVRRRRPRSACRRRLGRLPAPPPPSADGPPERPYPARHRPRSARRPPPGPPPSAAPAPPAGRRQGRLPAPPPLRRIDGLKKPTEKADTVEKKTPGERTKAGKRLLHQRRLRGLGGAGCRPPTHLQTRSPLFRLARSRPPFSSASPSSSPSMPSPRQGRHQVSFLLAFLPLLLVGWCAGAGSCSSVYPVGGIDALWLGFCTVNWALTAKKNCSCACHHIVVGCQFP